MNKHFSYGRGFTIVELMIVLALTATGFVALLKMQGQTLKAVGSSKNLTEAVNLAEHLMESLKTEAIEWTMPGSLMVAQTTRFPRLSKAGTSTPGNDSGWLQTMLPPSDPLWVGPLGNDTDWDLGMLEQFPPQRNPRFCVQYRLTWLVAEDLMRADVRVLWIRDEGQHSLYQTCPLNMIDDISTVASVSLSGSIMRNVFTR